MLKSSIFQIFLEPSPLSGMKPIAVPRDRERRFLFSAWREATSHSAMLEGGYCRPRPVDGLSSDSCHNLKNCLKIEVSPPSTTLSIYKYKTN
ncbi:Uncharacterized protein FKW44_010587 [Caligus rogercresseyi]|uniref:Uncharacterized protein n=1 Tax=Caligus rogercresseyi TaxID=217165 RepID=A0A7T8HHT9_CALRO|nr:Uncharacterized protein FKW44_010587 [Caligus rogercresseyi]